MASVHSDGLPTILMTFTLDPEWTDNRSQLLTGPEGADMCVIEFQRRGLLHAYWKCPLNKAQMFALDNVVLTQDRLPLQAPLLYTVYKYTWR